MHASFAFGRPAKRSESNARVLVSFFELQGREDREPRPAFVPTLGKVFVWVVAGVMAVSAGVAVRSASRERSGSLRTGTCSRIGSTTARGRLLDGEPVARAAAGVGFHDQAHFTRHFKRHVGTTPASYASATRSGPGRSKRI